MTSHQLHTEIEISASADRVWEVISDFAAYLQWNPYIRSVAGRSEQDARLRITVQPIGGKPIRFSPVVLTAKAGKELRWRDRLLLPGIFDGEHSFFIEPLDEGKVRFKHSEHFSGLLVGLLRASLLECLPWHSDSWISGNLHIESAMLFFLSGSWIPAKIKPEKKEGVMLPSKAVANFMDYQKMTTF